MTQKRQTIKSLFSKPAKPTKEEVVEPPPSDTRLYTYNSNAAAIEHLMVTRIAVRKATGKNIGLNHILNALVLGLKDSGFDVSAYGDEVSMRKAIAAKLKGKG